MILVFYSSFSIEVFIIPVIAVVSLCGQHCQHYLECFCFRSCSFNSWYLPFFDQSLGLSGPVFQVLKGWVINEVEHQSELENAIPEEIASGNALC